MAAKFAITAASLGLKTRFIGLLGVDPLSRWLREKMKYYGVEMRAKTKEGVTAGITFVITYRDGSHHFIGYIGSNRELTIEDMDFNQFKSVKHLHRSGIWWGQKFFSSSFW